MPNPILEQIIRGREGSPRTAPTYLNNPNFQAAKRAYQMVQSSTNPQAVVQNLIAENPQLRQIAQMAGAGGNYKQVFMQMARQYGIDPDKFIQDFQQ